MADPFGLSVAANLASSPIGVLLMYLITVYQAVKVCRSEAANLWTQLEKIKPGAEWLEAANLELERSGLQGDPTGAVEWVRDLRVKLDEASKTLESCREKTAKNLFHGPATAKKLTELNKKFEELASQVTAMRIGITGLLCSVNVSQNVQWVMEKLATNYTPRPELPVVNPTVFLSARWHEDMAVVRANSESAGLHAVWHGNGAQEGSYPPVPEATQFQQQPHCQDHSGYDRSSHFSSRPWH